MFSLSTGSDAVDGQTRTARVGKWTYTPVPPGAAEETDATLHREGLEVNLHYSSSIFEDFLDTVFRIQDEFNRRSQEVAALKAPTGESRGRMPRV
ncbi:hypothetical protein [Streptomyces sp. NPDC093225]|uniref:hypothetical protein n=1 Tax=Streptomyces sp. NPDC093225 TaxID=3366034 RepID=UPI0038180669